MAVEPRNPLRSTSIVQPDVVVPEWETAPVNHDSDTVIFEAERVEVIEVGPATVVLRIMREEPAARLDATLNDAVETLEMRKVVLEAAQLPMLTRGDTVDTTAITLFVSAYEADPVR